MATIDASEDILGKFSVYVREISDEGGETMRRVGGWEDRDCPLSSQQSNVITDAGWNWYFTSGATYRLYNFHNRCWVGTGTAEHTVESRNLTSPINYSVVRRNSLGSGDVTIGDVKYYRVRNEYLLNSPSIRGVPLSELAVGMQSNSMHAGQLIKDEFGEPTTVVLKENEEMIVRYDIFFRKPDTSYVEVGSGVYSFKGDEYPYTIEVSKRQTRTHEEGYIGGYEYTNRMYINKTFTETPTPSRVKTASTGKIDWNMNVSIGGGESYNISELGYVVSYNYSGRDTPDIRIVFSTPLPKAYDDTLTIQLKYGVKWRDA